MRRPALLRRATLARDLGRPWELAPAAPPDDHRVALRVLERGDRSEFLALARDSRDLHRLFANRRSRPRGLQHDSGFNANQLRHSHRHRRSRNASFGK